jgi:hypothetical protein
MDPIERREMEQWKSRGFISGPLPWRTTSLAARDTGGLTRGPIYPYLKIKYKTKINIGPHILELVPPNLVLSPPIWYLQVFLVRYFLFFHHPISLNGWSIFFQPL